MNEWRKWLMEWRICTAIGWCNWFWRANRYAYSPFKTFSSCRLIAFSIVTDEKFNKTLKPSTRIQSIWGVFEKKTYHKASKFIKAHTGIVYFVIHYVFFVYLCFISWGVCFLVILVANLILACEQAVKGKTIEIINDHCNLFQWKQKGTRRLGGKFQSRM